jgi:hypothetical protein
MAGFGLGQPSRGRSSRPLHFGPGSGTALGARHGRYAQDDRSASQASQEDRAPAARPGAPKLGLVGAGRHAVPGAGAELRRRGCGGCGTGIQPGPGLHASRVDLGLARRQRRPGETENPGRQALSLLPAQGGPAHASERACGRRRGQDARGRHPGGRGRSRFGPLPGPGPGDPRPTGRYLTPTLCVWRLGARGVRSPDPNCRAGPSPRPSPLCQTHRAGQRRTGPAETFRASLDRNT